MKSALIPLIVAVSSVLAMPNLGRAQYFYNSPTETMRPYFRVGMGPAFTEAGTITEFGGSAAGNRISYDTGIALDTAVGFSFNPWIAVELETGFIDNGISHVNGFVLDDTDLYNVPIMANVTFKYNIPRTIITPYVGAGVGGSIVGFDTDYFSNGRVYVYGNSEDFVFAYQFYAGVRIEINNRTSIVLGYKYFATDDTRFTYESAYPGGPDLHLGISGVRSHVVTLSVNLKF